MFVPVDVMAAAVLLICGLCVSFLVLAIGFHFSDRRRLVAEHESELLRAQRDELCERLDHYERIADITVATQMAVRGVARIR